MVYFNPSYVSLYETKESKPFNYFFQSGHHFFSTNSLRTGDTLKSAYGYGGYICNTNEKSFIQESLNRYDDYCKKQNIKKEVIFQHPFNKIIDKSFFTTIELNREVVYVQLFESETEQAKHYSKTTRNILTKPPQFILKVTKNYESFIDIYYKTMDKNNADEKYYFKEDYFKNLMKIEYTVMIEAILNTQTIAAAIFFIKPPFASYHLSANTPLSYELNANYHILNHAFRLAYSNYCTKMLLGGGKTPNSDDPLLAFKKKFQKSLMPFYILEKDFL